MFPVVPDSPHPASRILPKPGPPDAATENVIVTSCEALFAITHESSEGVTLVQVKRPGCVDVHTGSNVSVKPLRLVTVKTAVFPVEL